MRANRHSLPVHRVLTLLLCSSLSVVQPGVHGWEKSSSGIPQPIYFNFFVHLDDHVTDHALPATSRIAELYAKYGIKGDFYPIDLTLKRLIDKWPEVIETLKRLDMPISYHGPTHHPLRYLRIDLAKAATADWDEMVDDAHYAETHLLNPLTGELEPNQVGGLQLLTNTFGYPPILIIGRPASLLYTTKAMGGKMAESGGSMMGWPPYWEIGLIRGGNGPGNYGFHPNSIGTLARHKSKPQPWDDMRPLPPAVNVIKAFVETLPRDRVNFISFGLHPYQMTLSDMWDVCYTNTRNKATLPKELFGPAPISAAEQELLFAAYEAVVKYVAENPRVRAVTVRDILAMVEPLPEKRQVLRADVLAIAHYLRTNWSTYPPDYVDLGREYYSLADTFQALAQSLAGYKKDGVLPGVVEIREILGPTETPVSVGSLPNRFAICGDLPRTLVRGDDVVQASAAVTTQITDRVPGTISLPSAKPRGTLRHDRMMENLRVNPRYLSRAIVNPAEFLYLMAVAVIQISEKGKPGDLVLEPSRVTTDHSERTARKSTPLAKWQWHDMLQGWTRKPAKLKKG